MEHTSVRLWASKARFLIADHVSGVISIVYLKRICIKNLFSFKSAEFPLGDYTVIVGPNNSGKTNLLRILEMVATNENFEYFLLHSRHKLDTDGTSELTLTLDLDESEVRMAFECIFGLEGQINQVSEQLRTLRITIYWDKKQEEMVLPKFAIYQFGSGYTLAARYSGENIVFDRRVILTNDGEYERMIDSWRTAESADIFGQTTRQFETRRFDKIANKDAFLDDMLNDRRFDSKEYYIVQGLPMSVRRNPLATTSIARLLREINYYEEGTNVPTGILLSRIFERGFSTIGEIHPSVKELAENMAKLRNSHHTKYEDMRAAFRDIAGGIEVLVEQDGNGEEHILVEESGKRYDIKDSASGHYALACILSLLHSKPSGLVAVDEPEVHLHPQMVSRLHRILDDRARRNGVQTIVVTHSPKFVTHRQIRGNEGARLIMVTRPGATSLVHADTTGSEFDIKPHLINPEIFFGKGSLIVEGPSDYFVQKAISDFHDGLFEECNIVLIDSRGKHNIPPHVELHRRFNISYHCMADGDFMDDLDHVTILEGDLEAELAKMGVKKVRKKEDHRVYEKVIDFLKNSNDQEWHKSGIWKAFESAVQETGGSVSPRPASR